MEGYQNVIEEIYLMVEAGDNPGEIASYIPELRNVKPHMFGVCLTTLAGH
jgi:glutaminase